jgi:predicted CoA-binding protein
MNRAIEEFIKCRSIAVVGLSRSGRKFGNSAFAELAKRGYEVFAVHPHADEIGGTKCVPHLGALRGSVEGVLVCIPPGKVLGVLTDASASGVRNVWLQQGAESPEAIALAEDLGLNLVSKKCILMYAPPVEGFHAWHRAVHRIFAKL